MQEIARRLEEPDEAIANRIAKTWIWSCSPCPSMAELISAVSAFRQKIIDGQAP